MRLLLLPVLIAVGALTAMDAAAAQERQVGSACAGAMRRVWPRVAAPADAAAARASLAEFPALRIACAQDGAALDDLALAEATDEFHLGDAPAALAALEARKPAPGSVDYVTAEWLYLSAAQAAGDAARFRKERDAFLAAHDAALRKLPGFTKVEEFETPRATVAAYRTDEPGRPYIFIARPKGDSEPVILSMVHVGMRERHYTFNADTCWISGSGGDPLWDTLPEFAGIKAYAIRAFSNTKSGALTVDEMFPPFAGTSSAHQPCSKAAEILPAFADAARLTGGEYTPDGAALAEGPLERMLKGSRAQKDRAVAYITHHPDAVPPADYLDLVGDLMMRGDNLQAAFWFYVYEIRIAPWEVPSTEPDAGYRNTAYSTLDVVFGGMINGWAASDYDGWRGLMLRASSYERKAPLYPGRADGVGDKAWAGRIAKGRAAGDAAAIDKYLPDTLEKKQEMESKRKANGFYVGPWQAPGAPLDESWR